MHFLILDRIPIVINRGLELSYGLFEPSLGAHAMSQNNPLFGLYRVNDPLFTGLLSCRDEGAIPWSELPIQCLDQAVALTPNRRNIHR
jgi:hypothetical protein